MTATRTNDAEVKRHDHEHEVVADGHLQHEVDRAPQVALEELVVEVHHLGLSHQLGEYSYNETNDENTCWVWMADVFHGLGRVVCVCVCV
jgi:hypothetical protein